MKPSDIEVCSRRLGCAAATFLSLIALVFAAPGCGESGRGVGNSGEGGRPGDVSMESTGSSGAGGQGGASGGPGGAGGSPGEAGGAGGSGGGPGGAGGAGGGARGGGGRSQVARVVLSRSTNSPEVDVAVYSDASAERIVNGPPGVSNVTPAEYAAGSAEVAAFLSDLDATGGVSTIPIEPCPKSVSFGTTLKVTAGEQTSGDLECTSSTATSAQRALFHDCVVLVGGHY